MKKKKIRLSGGYRAAIFAIILALISIIVLNVVLIRRAETEQIEAEGQTRLSSIAGRVDNSLYRSECILDSVAVQVEQIISSGGDVPALLDDYFCEETIADISSRSDGSCFGAYAAYNGELYINDFIPDEDFVLDERSWFVGAKKRMGAVNVTEPYIDASTGEMCYSISKLLSDGSTIVGLDFNLSGIQRYIEEMNTGGSGTSFIVDADGMIVGHSDPSLIGSDYRQLDLYYELVNKVFMLYGHSFDYRYEGARYNIFSDKTNYDWYLVVCVKRGEEYSVLSGDALFIVCFTLVLAAAVVILFVHACKRKAAAENALAEKEHFLKDMSSELRRPLSRIVNRADILGSSAESGSTAAEIGDSANELEHMLDELISHDSSDVSRSEEETSRRKEHSPVNHVVRIALVTFVLLATGIVTFIFNTMAYSELSNVRMEQEAEIYVDQVRNWTLTNKTVLDVIADSIAAQPHFTEDYENAVRYLDSIVSKYDDISVAYICNPAWEHTVFMNNGWEPDENWHVEERQWYIDTMVSRDNFSVSAPYLDEQTGLYCTTLSKIVYDEKGNFIGVLGIDYYLDKLIGILGESYTDRGYAFITDIDGNILNHPNEEYQMKPGYSVNAADSCYRTALSGLDGDTVIFTDHDGVQKSCLAKKEDVSGFNVFVVRSLYDFAGRAVFSDIIYIVVFALCIIIVNVIMLSLTRWQERVNKELKEAADKAISAGKAKNDFLANMSHEIRTPINAVLGMNEMIMRESGEKQIVEYAANIQSAGRTLLSIINDILDFSKIESGKMEIVPVSYDVSSLINDIVNMVRIRAEKKKLTFIYEIDENIPSVLYGDDVRLRQVITNILTNAVKYTPEGYVRFRMNVVSAENDVVRIGVSVTDTGIGIREEDMDKLFASFQRLDQEKNRSVEGTGLGMSIVQRLLNMMGSELKVSSVYGSGSTFSFEIEQKIVKAEPIGDFGQRFKAAAEQHDTEAVQRTAPRARILVVDDNETNLLVAKSLLKRTLVQLDTAPSGAKCIELLKQKSYNIVFLDHMMPEMDGIETLKRIKEENIGGDSCFIALTANAIHGARQNYLDAGFDDYLSKPFTGMDIERCLFGHISEELWEYVKASAEEVQGDNAPDPEAAEDGGFFSPEEGAKYVGGDMETYKDILSLYVRKAPELSARIGRLFDEKDMKNYVIEVHALKSSSLNAGFKELSELAKELELAGKAGNYAVIEEKNGELLELYKKAMDIGREYLGEPEQTAEADSSDNEPLTEMAADKVKEYLEKIKEACLAFDSDEAERLCGEISGCSVNGMPLRPVLSDIIAAAEDFEYEAAAVKADELAGKL